MKTHYLDNPVWHNLAGPHARYAAGSTDARRYARGFPPIAGFRDLERPAFHALASYVEPGEHLYCDGWTGVAPAGWRIESECALITMTMEGPAPSSDNLPEAVQLDMRHASAALELAALTRPGPFSFRSIALGEYAGVFDGSRLIAMAGVRACAGRLGEISGVCTHPDFRGKGLAEHLIRKLVRQQMQRGHPLFLRVMQNNAGARRLYERIGFQVYRETVARTVLRD